MIVTIQEDYTVTIPAEVLEELELDEGDCVDIQIELIDDVPCIVIKKVDDDDCVPTEEDY